MLKEFMHERVIYRRGAIEHLGKEYINKERWRLLCRDIFFGDVPGENKASETINR